MADPTISAQVPSSGAVDVSNATTISFTVADTDTGIEGPSLTVEVREDGGAYETVYEAEAFASGWSGSVVGNGTGWDFSVTKDTPFDFGIVVDVRVTATEIEESEPVPVDIENLTAARCAGGAPSTEIGLEAPYVAAFNAGVSALTVSFWYYKDTNWSTAGSPVGMAATGMYKWVTQVVGTGSIAFQLGSGTLLNGRRWESPEDTLALNTWHHICFVYDNGAVTLEVDGTAVSLAEIGTGTATMITTDSPLRMFYRSAGVWQAWRTRLDEVAVWVDVALDSVQRNQLRYSGGPADLLAITPNPTVWYRFSNDLTDEMGVSDAAIARDPSGSGLTYVAGPT